MSRPRSGSVGRTLVQVAQLGLPGDNASIRNVTATRDQVLAAVQTVCPGVAHVLNWESDALATTFYLPEETLPDVTRIAQAIDHAFGSAASVFQATTTRPRPRHSSIRDRVETVAVRVRASAPTESVLRAAKKALPWALVAFIVAFFLYISVTA
jgi:hypothetical protein